MYFFRAYPRPKTHIDKVARTTHVTEGGSTIKWSPQVTVARPDVCPGRAVDESGNNSGVAVLARQVQCRLGLEILVVHSVLVAAQNLFHNLETPVLGGNMQWCLLRNYSMFLISFYIKR